MVRRGAWLLVVLVATACGSGEDKSGWISDGSGSWDSLDQQTTDGHQVEPERRVPEELVLPEVAVEVAPDLPSGPHPGDPCTSSSDCFNAPCVPTPGGLKCSMICSDECTGFPDWFCFPKMDQWAPGLCLQPDWIVCHPCRNDADCIEEWSGRHYTCVDYPGQGRFCASECDSAADCLAGYDCETATYDGQPLTGKLCQAQSGECPCEGFHIGGQSVCANSNEHGSCPGTLLCTDSGFVCDGSIPVAELCNGKDDNCNDQIDEGMGKVSCGQGICLHEVDSCLGGSPVFCNPMEGMKTETCNGFDDNCNGEIDEFWPDLGLPCDSPADEDKCANGVLACLLDGSDALCENDLPAFIEECDGKDNDCDGLTDEGLGKTSCGLGICAKTVDNCQGGELVECDPMAEAEPSDLPDLAGTDSNCDGIDGDLAKAVLVDGTAGKDQGADGTVAKPFKTVAAAQAYAATVERNELYIGKGTYTEPFAPAAGFAYYGLFNPSGGWSRGPFNYTAIGKGNPAILCNGQDDWLLDGFAIAADSAGGTGQSSYGARLVGCTGVILRNLTLQAGSGSGGTGGVDGGNGGGGGDGGNGGDGCEFTGGYSCKSCGWPALGTVGTSPCGALGGQGGQGGAKNESGKAGKDGTGGAKGGAGGAKAVNGSPGDPGPSATAGTAGASGEWNGTFGASAFLALQGSDGTAGGNGHGGGGGGGGGGDTQGYCSSYGGSGGSGGGGGCGGGKGTGGMGGGGSFALYLVDSSATIDGSKLYGSFGGIGGPGGKGGKGGIGGKGGQGGKGKVDDNEGAGAVGGVGSPGGAGGPGAGGHGGPSIAVVCVGDSALQQSDSTLLGGSGGVGGEGGEGGQAGKPGPSLPTWGCP